MCIRWKDYCRVVKWYITKEFEYLNEALCLEFVTRAPMELRVPCSADPNHHDSPPTQHDLTTPRMRPLKFESCLSVPNEPRLDKNVPRLHPDAGDGATNSADSSPDLPPNHQRVYFSPVPRVSPEWATTERRLTRQRYEPPRTSPGFSRLCHGGATNHAESAWFGARPRQLLNF